MASKQPYLATRPTGMLRNVAKPVDSGWTPPRPGLGQDDVDGHGLGRGEGRGGKKEHRRQRWGGRMSAPKIVLSSVNES
jgi:hypothetical protein